MEGLVGQTFEAGGQVPALPLSDRGLNAVLRGTLTRAIIGRADASDLMDVVRLVEAGRADSRSLAELAGQIKVPEVEAQPVSDDRVRQALLESLALINNGAMEEAARPLEAMIDTRDAWMLLGLIHDISIMKSLHGEERSHFEGYAAQVISHLLLENKYDTRCLIRDFQMESIHLESPYNWLLNVIYRRTRQHILLDWLGRAYDILIAEIEAAAQGEDPAYYAGLRSLRKRLVQVEEVWYRWIGFERSDLETVETQRGVVEAGYHELLGLVKGCQDLTHALERPPASPLEDFVRALKGTENILRSLIRLMRRAQVDLMEGHLAGAAQELQDALAYDPQNDLLAELIVRVEGGELPELVTLPAEPELSAQEVPLILPQEIAVQEDQEEEEEIIEELPAAEIPAPSAPEFPRVLESLLGLLESGELEPQRLMGCAALLQNTAHSHEERRQAAYYSLITQTQAGLARGDLAAAYLCMQQASTMENLDQPHLELLGDTYSLVYFIHTGDRKKAQQWRKHLEKNHPHWMARPLAAEALICLDCMGNINLLHRQFGRDLPGTLQALQSQPPWMQTWLRPLDAWGETLGKALALGKAGYFDRGYAQLVELEKAPALHLVGHTWDVRWVKSLREYRQALGNCFHAMEKIKRELFRQPPQTPFKAWRQVRGSLKNIVHCLAQYNGLREDNRPSVWLEAFEQIARLGAGETFHPQRLAILAEKGITPSEPVYTLFERIA